MKPTLPLVLTLAAAPLAQTSELIGGPLPEVALSRAVQGAPFGPEELAGTVVVLDVFQLG